MNGSLAAPSAASSVVVNRRAECYTGVVAGLKPLKHNATYEDLCAVPDIMVAEIVDGDLYASPRPAFPHARAASALFSDVAGPYDRGRGGPGGWLILFEPELHLGPHVLVPDLAGWRRSRLPVTPNVAFSTLEPDWLCEVVSPSTARLDRIKKLDIYARAGVPCLWLVDPLERMLEVFRLENGRWVRTAAHGDDEVARVDPFDAIEIDLLALWDERRAPAAGTTPNSQPPPVPRPEPTA